MLRLSLVIVLAANIALTVGCSRANAATQKDSSVFQPGPVALKNGANTVEILGDGSPAQVFVAWRGNYNAHGFSAATFYVRGKSDRSDSAEWNLVPFFGGPQDGVTGRNEFLTSEGADCTVGDIRVVQKSHAAVEIVIGKRDLAKSFVDSEPVHFDYYKLTRNTDDGVGRPPYFFQFTHSVAAKHNYCDVNVAFNKELSLGVAGIAQSDASSYPEKH
ncbi:MAG: hypothetical protein ABJB66_02735 [Gemmatimonadaceae bacterium]